MRFVTFSDLNNDIIKHLPVLPRDVDIIIGIPRSGLLVANMIALYLNKPVVDIDSFCRREISSIGRTKSHLGIIEDFSSIKTALVVDDSIDTGISFDFAREKLQHITGIEYRYFAAYIRTDKQHKVDYYLEIIDSLRMFEWNYLNIYHLRKVCFDLDGVLCVDPTDNENDDGEQYRLFLQQAKPLLVPTTKVGYIVSCRLEKYRSLTEEWLKKNGIDFGELILMQYENAGERLAHGKHAEYKASFYKKQKDTILFVESSEMQAEKINSITHKPVFCIENQKYYEGSKINEVKFNTTSRIKLFMLHILPPDILKLINKCRKTNKKH